MVAAAAVITGVVLYVRKKIRRASSVLLGTHDIIKGIKNHVPEGEEQPQSLSNMALIYEPLIAADFPDFNLKEFITMTENMLLSVLNAIEAKNADLIVNASKLLHDRIEGYIEDLNSKGEAEYYDDIRIHKTVLTKYEKKDGLCAIMLQSGVEYKHFVKDRDGKIINGSASAKRQIRYNTELVYVQDAEKVTAAGGGNAIGVNCPNCGASVKNLGSKVCEYCGTAIIEVNVKSWTINKCVLVK